MASCFSVGRTLPLPGNSIRPKSRMAEEKAVLETCIAGDSDQIHHGSSDSETLDSYEEEECTADQCSYQAYAGYKEAPDALNQVRRRRGFWPVIAVPAPDSRAATLAVRSGENTFRGGEGKRQQRLDQQWQREQRRQRWKE